MQIHIYRCEYRYLATWCKDNGELLTLMPLKSLGKGLLVADVALSEEIDQLCAWKSEWRGLPYEPCLVAMPHDSVKSLFLDWGFYSEKDLSPLDKEKVVPLNCLMDYISDFLSSHEDYCVNLYHIWEIHGGATHHMTSLVRPFTDATFKGLLETLNRYLSEVL